MKVLLVDDDVDLLDVTGYALRREGFNVVSAVDGQQALRLWEGLQPDVVVLDIGLPRVSGFDVCRRIREKAATPVIFLSGRTDEANVVQGFRLGGDDYVTKPFSTKQLAMRIRAVARRVVRDKEGEPTRDLRLGDLALDLESREARWGSYTVHLTLLEFRLLYMLSINAGRVVPATRLVEYAWGGDGGDLPLLKTHISHIRSKLQLPSSGPGSIRAIHGVGYRFFRPDAAEASQAA